MITLVIGVLFVHETRDVDIMDETLAVEFGSLSSSDAMLEVDLNGRPCRIAVERVEWVAAG